MKVLVEGKITNKDLADWFGISEGSFKNKKKAKLDELRYFAEFEEQKGKIIVTKVLNPIYSKLGSLSYRRVCDSVDEVWNENGMDTCKHVGEKIYNKLKDDDDFHLSSGTVLAYTLRSRNELYGKPFATGGKLGHCIYTWGRLDIETGDFEPLTEEEVKVKEELYKKYFGSADDNWLFVLSMVLSGEITEGEAGKVMNTLSAMSKYKYLSFLGELKERLGSVGRCTLVVRHAIEEDNIISTTAQEMLTD